MASGTGLVREVTVTPALDDGVAYADGDVLFETVKIPNAMRKEGEGGLLHSVRLLDKDEEGVKIELYILDSLVDLGTLNAAANISDADAESILAVIPIETTDYEQLVNSRVANLDNVGRVLKPAANSRDLYIGGIVRGTPTFANADDIQIKLGIVAD